MMESPANHANNLLPLLWALFIGSWLPLSEAIATGVVEPDLLISGNSQSGFKGDGIKNTTGVGQTLTRRTKGKAVKTFFKAQNEGGRGTIPFTFKGKRGNRDFNTKYFQDGANVTAKVIKGTYTVDIATASEITFRQKVKPTRRLRGRSERKLFRFTGSHAGNTDTVVVIVKKKN